MMVVLVYFALFLALTGHSSGIYCVCKEGVSESALQKTLDYACGAGADCTPILQNGGCYQPNTVKDHCSYAVNSYFQRKGQTTGSCDFAGTAMTSPTPPSTVPSSCVYQATPGSTGTPTTTPTSTPGMGTTPTGTTPSGTNTTPTGTSPSPNVFGTGTGAGTGTGTGTTSTGLGPAGSGSIDNNSPSGSPSLPGTNLFTLTLLFSAPFLWWG